MKLGELPANPTHAQLASYMASFHSCMETHFQQADMARSKISRRIKIDGGVNLIAMGGLLFTLATTLFHVTQWTSSVDQKLAVIGSVVNTVDNHTKTLEVITKEVADEQNSLRILTLRKAYHDKRS